MASRSSASRSRISSTHEEGRTTRVKRWRETLPNGVSYTTLDMVDGGFYDNTPVYHVLPGHYFMMGDNRDNSTDSRFLSQVGYVPFENIIGRAQIIFFSVAEGERAWRSGAGPGLCAGAGCSRSCDEPQGRRRQQLRRRRNSLTNATARCARLRNLAARAGLSPGAADRRRGALEERIGYRFSDAALLERGLTHISALMGSTTVAAAISGWSFSATTCWGLLSPTCSSVPSPRPTKANCRAGSPIWCGGQLRGCRARDRSWRGDPAGASEANAGGRLRTAILADVCEALIGAVFLDGGYAAAAAMVERLWGDRMRTPVRPLRDAKTMLQEWAQARGLPTPAYHEVARTGPHHDPEFRVAVELPDRPPAEGLGRSKRAAEQAAAAAMLAREGVSDRSDG